MQSNIKLHAAKAAKNDEMYTRYKDIEIEMSMYSNYFRNKTVYCPCDNAYTSNFVKYFIVNFNNCI